MIKADIHNWISFEASVPDLVEARAALDTRLEKLRSELADALASKQKELAALDKELAGGKRKGKRGPNKPRTPAAPEPAPAASDD